jgi:predicted peptidase
MCILRGAPGGGPAHAANIYAKRTFISTGGPYREGTFRYRLLVPADNDLKAKEEGKLWPLVLFLHGAGERGADNEAQLKYLPADMASAENRARFPCFLLAPQCPSGRSWSDLSLQTLEATFGPEPVHEARVVLEILDTLLGEFPIDRSRLYLTGISMGGYGSWDLAARHPEKWAAVAPICGGGDPKTAPRMRDLPIWAFHGAKDPIVNVERSRAMVEALKAAGGSPKYTEFPDAGHDSWTPAYRLPEFLPWLFAQRKAGAAAG